MSNKYQLTMCLMSSSTAVMETQKKYQVTEVSKARIMSTPGKPPCWRLVGQMGGACSLIILCHYYTVIARCSNPNTQFLGGLERRSFAVGEIT